MATKAIRDLAVGDTVLYENGTDAYTLLTKPEEGFLPPTGNGAPQERVTRADVRWYDGGESTRYWENPDLEVEVRPA